MKKYSTKKLVAKKSLGQNFLVNPGVLDKVVKAAELDKDDVVIEVGPGTGVLTEKLSEKVRRVISVEKDRRLIEGLENKFGGSNVEIVEADVLKFNPSSYPLMAGGYKVIGNIPYYITSHLLKTIFEKWPKPELVVLMVQKEVAQRIVAKPPHMNLLALSVQFYAEPKIISYVSRGSFRPIPKVDSAIIRLVPKIKTVDEKQKEEFFKIIKRAFAGKRKQLKNTLTEISFKKVGISEKTRPEKLGVDDWLRIVSKKW